MTWLWPARQQPRNRKKCKQHRPLSLQHLSSGSRDTRSVMEHPRSLRTVIIVEANTSPRSAGLKRQPATFAKSLGIWLGFVARKRNRKPRQGRERCIVSRPTTPIQVAMSTFIARSGTKPYIVKVTLNDAPLDMELDTGAAVSLISKATYNRLWETAPQLVPTTTRLHTYSRQQLVVLGTLTVTVKYEAQQVVHPIIVVEGASPSLLGSSSKTCNRNELGEAKNITAMLHLAKELLPSSAMPAQFLMRCVRKSTASWRDYKNMASYNQYSSPTGRRR